MPLATRQLCLAALVAVAVSANTLGAQDSIPARKPFVVGLTVNAMSIDAVTAGDQLVGGRSFGMQFDGGLVVKHMYLGVDFGPQFLSDKASFTQNTTGGEMSSTAMLVYFSALAGPRTPSMQLIPGMAPVAFGLYGGVSTTVSERSIDNCTDCRKESMDIPGGTFVQPVLLMGAGRARLRLSDRVFVGGKGIRSVMSVGVELGAQ
jgi:hypothetical protein